MFEHIKACLNEYDAVVHGEHIKQGYLNEAELDVLEYFDFNIAKALMKEKNIDAEKVAKFILVTKGLYGDIKVNVK